ncbi:MULTISPECIES: type VI secretion system baseplate subunit TssK [unclassified Janthinobacterium]|uniref:type VI secretion system baseplate subunit TssK n=1 Tax=unclassified Janthinobacterium TaxID=2610881 RepID=UPI0008F50AF7|nr:MULTISPECIES: type VI secretion system baseplate subunit TssK [unclassified Janthinobacterium]APA69174.1 type VI secretion protein [Janthinobacterium sp. 1_2014MBL_MicDiv]MDN2712315.1 type VI secretion system baseplate subunit TssK [Janthinobacterium sp. SUN118]
MSVANKLLWGEGLFLRPQHFQQQDQYHEHRLHESVKALHPYAWGVSQLQIDRDALGNHTLRLLELSLIFQDGEIYNAAGADELPEAIDLGNLPPSQQSVTFYAALPAFKQFGGNFASAGQPNSAARYGQANLSTPDLYTQAAQAELTYLKKSLRLVAESDPRDSYVSFPLLRLRRLSTGGFEQDPAFVPPSLSIRSAPLLFLQLRRLIDALQAKVNALYGHHREPSKSVIEFRSGDMSSFWLLHTASSAFASLSHYFHHPALHPERLYEQLLGLAGALMTFSKTHALADLPAYRHADPGPPFAQLHAIIRELLDTVISSKYFAIALSETKPSYHHGKLDSEKIDGKTAFYLGVSADMPGMELVDVVPLRFKVGAPDDVEKFVLSALPGVRLQHAPQVPAAVPVRPDAYYFTIEAKGQMYERMLQAQSVLIYVPSGMRDLKLELVAVTS